MSLLRMTCAGTGTFDAKVMGFSSPLTGVMISAQTKTKLQHFPFKASQQSFKMDLIMNGWEEYNDLQNFVRQHQLAAIPAAREPEVDLWWPERGINHWTGFVKNMQAGDKRFNFTPRTTLEFLLVDSLLSEKTWTSSFATDFREMFNTDIGTPSDPNSPDSVITPPTPPKQSGSDTPWGDWVNRLPGGIRGRS
jgi:hypothetical protein